MLNAGLCARLDEYLYDYPSDTPAEVIGLIRAILDCVASRIESTSDTRYLASLCQLISSFAGVLTYFDNAHTEQTPRALAQMLEHLTGHIAANTKLVVWPQADYNFTIRDILPPLRKAVENVLTAEEKDKVFNAFKGPVNLVSFPRIERDNIFVHPVFGHELGHPIAEEFLAAEKGTQKYLARLLSTNKKLSQLFSAEIRQQKNPLQRLQFEKRLIHTVLRIRERGLQELISDAVSVLLFGPSALFAALEIFAGEDLDRMPEFPSLYPPTRMRFRAMWVVMESDNFNAALRNIRDRSVREAVDEVLSVVNEVVSRKDDEAVLKKDHCLSVAYEWVNETVAEAVTFARNRLNPILYSERCIELEIPELVERVALRIPPNETGMYPHVTTVDWRSSMLAAWLHRLRRGSEELNLSESFPIEEVSDLQRITMLSIEASLLAMRHAKYIAMKQRRP